MPDPQKVEATAKSPIDTWLDGENAEAEKLIANSHREAEGPQPGAELAAPETPPAESPAAPAEPPKEPEKPAEPAAEAAKTAEPSEEEPPKGSGIPNKVWKAFRQWQESEGERKQLDTRLAEQERVAADLRRELEDLRKPKPAAAEQPAAEEPDPFTKTEQSLAATNAEVARMRAEIAERDQNLAIANEETAFRATHPDYDDARRHLMATEARIWNRNAAGRGVQMIFANPEAIADVRAISRNPARLAELGRLGETLNIEELKLPANPSERDIARVSALLGILEARRQELIATARADGIPIPQYAYEIVQEYGYRKAEPAPAAAPAGPTPQQRMAREKEKSEVAENLHSIPGSGPGPAAFKPRTRAELSEFYRTHSPAESEAWQEQMDALDPDWLQRLA